MSKQLLPKHLLQARSKLRQKRRPSSRPPARREWHRCRPYAEGPLRCSVSQGLLYVLCYRMEAFSESSGQALAHLRALPLER